MPMFEPSVAMITSQQPSSAALPAKQYPLVTPTSGTSPLSCANIVEREAVEPGDRRAVGVARPSAAAFGEEHDGKLHALRELEEPVLLLVVPHALRSREHRVVVRHRDDRVAVDGADAADEPVGRCPFDQLLRARGGDAARR